MAEHEPSETESRAFRALEMSCRILAEDCVRAAGHLVPDAKTVSQLLRSAVLQKTFSVQFGDDASSTVQALLDHVLKALEDERDADHVALALCTQCGMVLTGEAPETCPHCKASEVEAIP